MTKDSIKPPLPLQPYLFDAFYRYFADNGFKIYIQVDTMHPQFELDPRLRSFVDQRTQLICFNISPEAVSDDMTYDDSFLRCRIRVRGEPIKLDVPLGAVVGMTSPSWPSPVRLPCDMPVPDVTSLSLVQGENGEDDVDETSAGGDSADGKDFSPEDGEQSDGEAKTDGGKDGGRKPGATLRIV